MARIRTVKPDFFRHEGLNELETLQPRIMLFFAGLWCQCDKMGRFRWKPKTLKLDILPFVEYNPSTALEVLKDGGFISKYEIEGEEYGEITNFKKHQLIWGSELKAAEKFPAPSNAVPELYYEQSEDNGVRSQESGDTETLKTVFDEARKNYPGSKRGLDVEWQHIRKRFPKRLPEIVPLLLPGIARYRARIISDKIEPKFIKAFQGWISEERWTEETMKPADAPASFLKRLG